MNQKRKKSSKYKKPKKHMSNGKRKIDWILWFTLIQTIIAILNYFSK